MLLLWKILPFKRHFFKRLNMNRTTLNELLPEVLDILQKRDSFNKYTETDIINLSWALNTAIGNRLLKGERVQLKDIGVLYLKITEKTRKHIPGRGLVDIPARYEVEFNMAEALKNKFAGLPSIEENLTGDPVGHLGTDLSGELPAIEIPEPAIDPVEEVVADPFADTGLPETDLSDFVEPGVDEVSDPFTGSLGGEVENAPVAEFAEEKFKGKLPKKKG